MKKLEVLKELYNTEIVGNFRTELTDLGYVSIKSLGLEKEVIKEVVNEAKKGFNNLALSPRYPFVLCISKSFYQKYLINNEKKSSEISLRIKSRNSLFINKLMTYLEKESSIEFEISFSKIERPNVTRKEKLNFLRNRIMHGDFDVRTTNCLRSADLNSVFEIYEYRSRLFMIRLFGETCMKDIEDKFSENGLDFNDIPKSLIEEAKRPSKKNE